MDIIFYAGSLRPGGGLTVAQIMIEALAKDKSNNIVVYTGAEDASQALKPIFKSNKNIKEKIFFQKLNPEIRYLLSKFYFLPKSLLNRKTLLISVNYYIPVFCKQFVYHLNLLSFMCQKGDTFFKKIKEFDASLACRFATLNVFESNYLRKTAKEYTGINIRNPKLLYIGVDPVFFNTLDSSSDYEHNANILLVSSPQPHKDNKTCIKTLARLVKSNPNIPWCLTIAGGQTKEQWQELINFADFLGVKEKVRVLGPLGKKELSLLMYNSLCLISASKIESFCMVALEAMASKCPAIVTNDTSMPESVGDAAIIVESGSSEQFYQSILGLYNNEGSRKKLVHKGKAHTEKFTMLSFINELNIIINSLSNN